MIEGLVLYIWEGLVNVGGISLIYGGGNSQCGMDSSYLWVRK